MTASIYFHASRSQHNPGDRIAIAPGQTTHYARQAIASGNGPVDAQLDAAAPGGVPLRSTGVFAFEDLGHAMAYASAEPWPNWHFYEVSILPPFVRVPMALVERARQIGSSGGSLGALAAEYWCPMKTWQFYEIIASGLVIAREISLEVAAEDDLVPGVPAAGKVRAMGSKNLLQHDSDLAKKLF